MIGSISGRRSNKTMKGELPFYTIKSIELIATVINDHFCPRLNFTALS